MRQISQQVKYYRFGRSYLNSRNYVAGQRASMEVSEKRPTRTDIINYLLSQKTGNTVYLEIGVRNPADNFDRVVADQKVSVDPGVEFSSNPVDFKLTSDEFFSLLREGRILSPEVRFDVIFIDGLHVAEQVDRDIENSLDFLAHGGFVVLHDCNPPTESHAREDYGDQFTPAGGFWNGTTWKAYMKRRWSRDLFSCCIDTDWGVGVLSRERQIGLPIDPVNEFFDYRELLPNRVEHLNLLSFERFKQLFVTPASP